MACADLDHFGEFTVDEGFAHEVKRHLLGEGGNLFDDPFKEVHGHGLFASNDFRAEAALEIADVADLDIDLVKTLGHAGNLAQIQGFFNYI